MKEELHCYSTVPCTEKNAGRARLRCIEARRCSLPTITGRPPTYRADDHFIKVISFGIKSQQQQRHLSAGKEFSPESRYDCVNVQRSIHSRKNTPADRLLASVYQLRHDPAPIHTAYNLIPSRFCCCLARTFRKNSFYALRATLTLHSLLVLLRLSGGPVRVPFRPAALCH